jgi:cell division septation protein DedD
MSDEGFHEIQLNSKQLIFLCMAAALVLVVAFLSGVLVGRGVRSEKDAPAAEAVAAAVPVSSDTATGAPIPASTQSTAPPPAVAPPTPVDEDLTYEKRLEGKEAPKETLQPMPPPAERAKAKDAPKPTKEAAKPAKEAAKPAKDAAAAKASAPEPSKAAASFPEPAGGGYYLKIVAYRDRAQAESVARRLNGKGYSTYVVPAGSLHSVRVGKYRSRKEADSVRRRLEKEEQLKPLISH